jgi:hypothetical protein
VLRLRKTPPLVSFLVGWFKHGADSGIPVHDVAKAQERTAEACDIIIGRVQRIISEGNVAFCIWLSLYASSAFVPVGHFMQDQSNQ